MRCRRLLLALITSCLATVASAAGGSQGYAWIRNIERPAAEGLGGATTATFDPLNGPLGNPALMRFANKAAAEAGYRRTFEGVNAAYLTAAQPLSRGTLGYGITAISFGSLDEVRDDGLPTGESFSPYSFSFAAAYALPFGAWSLGSTLRLLSQSIHEESSMALALDLGAHWRREAFSLGAALRHVGKEVKKLRETAEDLPLTAHFGAAWSAGANQLAADLEYSDGGGTVLRTGAQHVHQEILAVSLGYTTLGRDQAFDPAVLDGISLGTGILLDSGAEFRYAATFQGDLGTGHRASLGYVFP